MYINITLNTTINIYVLEYRCICFYTYYKKSFKIKVLKKDTKKEKKYVNLDLTKAKLKKKNK
jgi:hypothetical protein